PIRDAAGSIRYGVATFVDISESRQIQQTLQNTENFLENLLDYANAPIIVWDPAFRVLRFNHAFERLTGNPAEKVVGRPLDILFPDHLREEAMAHIKRALAGEYWESVEIPIQRVDGSVRTV